MTLTLTKPIDTQIVKALDQKGNVFLGDLSAATVTVDLPDVVGLTLTDPVFVKGVAVLTLTQGTEGTATLTAADGAVTNSEPVDSYAPVLTSFAFGDIT